MENAFAYFIAFWFALMAVGSILLIGEDRKPTTKGTAAVQVVIYALLICGVFAHLVK